MSIFHSFRAGEMLTYTALRDQIAQTGGYQGQPVTISDVDETNFIRTKDALIGSLLEKLKQRFPSETMHVMKSFDAIFSPKLYPEEYSAMSAYGKEDLKQLLDHYQPADMNADIILNRDRCFRDFLQFKHHTRLHRRMGFADYIQLVVTTLGEEYPDYVVLGQLALCVPLNSASCERGFSSQNLTKNKARNRLGEQTLQDIMKISINGPHFAQFDYTEAARKFRAIKNRRK
ncbi:zinc finger protein 862-like [Mercenaria mercenaria]|uniref:zinc finger protein 862-like n=1 Tax=Mercenaria mercenaria TaxID=6596 RepID=UPI00234E4F81|nr:zinc finger protein 862-like [Mercenaria mercenaria]